MLGFVVGTLCLIALVRVVRRARAYRRHAYGYAGYGPPAVGYRAGGVDELFASLRATPEQEKLLRDAAGELRGVGRTAFGALRDSRKEYARAMAADVFDEAALAPAYSAQDEALTKLHQSLAGALLKAHAALEPDQRARLAAWMTRNALPGTVAMGPAPQEPVAATMV